MNLIMHLRHRLFNKFALAGLSIYFMYSPLTAIAGSRSEIIDNTPQEASVCRLDPNEKLLWSKPVKVFGIQGDVTNVVLDKDYTNPLDALFGDTKKQLFFTIWGDSSILLNRFVDYRNKWVAGGNISSSERFYVVVDGTEYQLNSASVDTTCVYGSETRYWLNTPVALFISNEAKSALLGTTENSTIILRWYKQDGNKVHRNESDIGRKTIESWKLIAQPIQAEELKEKRDCTATVATAQKNIETGRNVEVIVRSDDISKEYPDYPNNRPYTYIFLLRGSASESIMNSPKFMKSIAEKIISNCDSVSSVTFGVYQTGWGYSIGLMPDGKVDLFECLDQDGANRELRWGQEYCSL